MVLTRMNWSREMLMLQGAQRRAEQAANDARRNMRHTPGSVTPERLQELDIAARAAQDAVTAHHLVKAG